MNRFLVGIAAAMLVVAPARGDSIVVVGIDEKTIESLGPFGPTYRAYHEKLIEKLNAAGVRAIAFDVTFRERAGVAATTSRLAAAMAASRAPVVIGLDDGEPNAEVMARVGQGSIHVEMGTESNPPPGRPPIDDAFFPASRNGRRALALELALRAGGISLAQADAAGFDVPDGAGGTQRVLRAHTGDPKDVTTVSYLDVLDGKVDASVLARSLVFVGATDGHMDMWTNPATNERMPGVYFHAFTLRHLLGRELSKPRHLEVVEPDPKQPSSTRGVVGAVPR